jgi:hypothetical protein
MDIGYQVLRMPGSLDVKVMLEDELQRVYDSEINVRISWLWDGGIDIRLGDEVNGFLAEESVSSVDEILPWLQEAIVHFYPTSTYAASLDPEIRSRAATRLFRPPSVGATAVCPHCGAPNTSMMDEVIAYVCRRCGEAVKAEPSRVQ